MTSAPTRSERLRELMVCFHCDGSGRDANLLNDPGPCTFCDGHGEILIVDPALAHIAEREG